MSNEYNTSCYLDCRKIGEEKLLELSFWDPSIDTPIEILHLILLE